MQLLKKIGIIYYTMSKVTSNTVAYLASLSDLQLNTEEKDVITRELQQTVDALSTINEIDTSNTEPTFQTGGNVNVFQEEAIGERTFKESKRITITTHYYEK